MSSPPATAPYSFAKDVIAGLVVFLVALPLCLGVALASRPAGGEFPPLFAGLIAGVVGGIVVGIISRSHTSVSGPAAGLTAIVATEIAKLGSYESFLTAVVLAGVFQIALGLLRAGSISSFFPSSVVRGLLAAIGTILILKQVPHLLGHDSDPEGDMAFQQPDHENTFSELVSMLSDLHQGALVIGLVALALLIVWDKVSALKKSIIPAPLVVVVVGGLMAWWMERWGGDWVIGESHLVGVPTAKSLAEFSRFLIFPAYDRWLQPEVITTAMTLAVVASLETLLNLEAVDRLDPKQRITPSNRELVAQGIGNMVSGSLGGLPLTAVIVRGSVNISAGSQSKLSAILHGVFLLGCVLFLPNVLNQIPLSCLAAILIMTGYKLASPALIKQMWSEGKYQFIPFLATVIAIVGTDLLIGVLIGMGISIAFVLASNMRSPVKKVVEKHLTGEVTRIELANQVSFLNRASIEKSLEGVKTGTHVLIDGRSTNYIDPDVLSLLKQFKNVSGPARGIQVSLSGFREKYDLSDQITYVDYSTRDLQDQMTPSQVQEILKEGNLRFRKGQQLTRDLGRQMQSTSAGQHPLAVILSCIDSRTPVELIFDLGLGDVFSVRIAGNVIGRKVLGSIEFSCAVAGAKLVVVMGHSRCGAVSAAVKHAALKTDTGLGHLDFVVHRIQESFEPPSQQWYEGLPPDAREEYVTHVGKQNTRFSMETILQESEILRNLQMEGKIQIVGAFYDVSTGEVEFLD